MTANAPRATSRTAVVDLTVTFDTKSPAFIDTTLKIQTDVPGEEWLTVPVTALIE